MTCIKTGCHIYIIPVGVFAYGDAHEVTDGDSYYFRIVEEKDVPLANKIHFEINNYDTWWDRRKHEDGRGISTLIVAKSDVINYGYDGRDANLFPYVQ